MRVSYELTGANPGGDRLICCRGTLRQARKIASEIVDRFPGYRVSIDRVTRQRVRKDEVR